MSDSVTNNTSIPCTTIPQLRLADPGDAEAALVVEGMRNARQSRKLASASRQEAQQQQIDKLRTAADKLRDMAACSVISGVIQATAGLINGSLAGKSPAAEKVIDGFARADIPARIGAHYDADKRELEIGAEQAAKRAEDARDTIGEADRLQGSLRSQLERLYEARLAGERAAIRG